MRLTRIGVPERTERAPGSPPSSLIGCLLASRGSASPSRRLKLDVMIGVLLRMLPWRDAPRLGGLHSWEGVLILGSWMDAEVGSMNLTLATST